VCFACFVLGTELTGDVAATRAEFVSRVAAAARFRDPPLAAARGAALRGSTRFCSPR
jgi:hypothetical protein